MKIGILTQPLQDNYGGLLQNYALQTVLKREGHDVVTFDWKRKQKTTLKSLVFRLILIVRALINKKRKFPFTISDKERAYISQYTKKFIDSYINKSEKIFNFNGFRKCADNNNIEAIIVGSDQVWRPIYNSPYQGCMFLDFAVDKNIKRIAYAASFGTDKWEFNYQDTLTYSKLISKFDLVTVREDSGIFLCKNHFSVDAKHVLDPTMLINKHDYLKIVENANEPKSLGNLFYYILDPSQKKIDLVNRIANEINLVPFTIMAEYTPENRTKENVRNELDKCVFPSVTKWLRAFVDAEFVVCDSFHGCVFSIIFNKPFWVISNNYRGNARFSSLLKMFHLEDRLIDIESSNINFNSSIDWIEVNRIRETKKQDSLMLLLNSLKNG